MSSEHPPQCLDRLEAASTAFAKWRGSCEKRSPIPEELWQAAIALSPFYSVWRISKELKLDYAKLKRRIAEAACGGSSEFIEIRAPSIFSAEGCTIQLRSPAGFQMEIRADGSRPSQLLPFIDLFLAKSR